MEISFYVLLVLACLVLLLAMWACAGSNTPKWGPDLTLELPPHLLQEALFGPKAKLTTTIKTAGFRVSSPTPSAPSELPCDPLLSNEHQVSMSSPPARYYRPAPAPPVLMNMEGAVRVLPSQYTPNHKLKPVFCTFSTEEPA